MVNRFLRQFRCVERDVHDVALSKGRLQVHRGPVGDQFTRRGQHCNVVGQQVGFIEELLNNVSIRIGFLRVFKLTCVVNTIVLS